MCQGEGINIGHKHRWSPGKDAHSSLIGHCHYGAVGARHVCDGMQGMHAQQVLFRALNSPQLTMELWGNRHISVLKGIDTKVSR